jgi:hypothetical protein
VHRLECGGKATSTFARAARHRRDFAESFREEGDDDVCFGVGNDANDERFGDDPLGRGP